MNLKESRDEYSGGLKKWEGEMLEYIQPQKQMSKPPKLSEDTEYNSSYPLEWEGFFYCSHPHLFSLGVTERLWGRCSGCMTKSIGKGKAKSPH